MMQKLAICSYRSDTLPLSYGENCIVVSEKNIGKCRGCMRCRILKQCVSYMDDAQQCIPLVAEAEHLDLYLQSGGVIQRLLDRVLYALDGSGKTFTLHIEDDTEAEYVRRLLTWAKYREVQ